MGLILQSISIHSIELEDSCPFRAAAFLEDSGACPLEHENELSP